MLVGALALLPAVAVCQSPVSPADVQSFDREQRWDQISDDNWRYLRRGSSKNDEIVTDAAAPFSPPAVLKIVFTPDMGRDREPSVHWIPLDDARDVHAAWWIKLSDNWTPSPAGGGKMTFLHLAPDGRGQVYSNIGGPSAPHRININTEWAPYGQRFWDPNRTTTPIVYGRWYRIDWQISVPSGQSGRATLRWWVNGVLNGAYMNVEVPADYEGFQQFEFAPTLQNPPPHEQYMYIDHTGLTAR